MIKARTAIVLARMLRSCDDQDRWLSGAAANASQQETEDEPQIPSQSINMEGCTMIREPGDWHKEASTLRPVLPSATFQLQANNESEQSWEPVGCTMNRS